MERREPTLSGGANNDRDDVPIRRSAPSYDEPIRTSRGDGGSASPVPAIALTIALLGVAAAGVLGWMLLETQTTLAKDAARIAQLESQLDVTSTNSTQSVGALQINLQKVDSDVKKLQEVVRKLNSDHSDKLASLGKSLDGAKSEINSLKGDTNSLKQDSLAHKATLEDFGPRIDSLEKNIAEQRKKITDVAASVNIMLNQVKSAEGLAARINKTEEAIDAIDDNRRTINKDLLQIKQQLGIKN
jgi:chromosome segregation ATPase